MSFKSPNLGFTCRSQKRFPLFYSPSNALFDDISLTLKLKTAFNPWVFCVKQNLISFGQQSQSIWQVWSRNEKKCKRYVNLALKRRLRSGFRPHREKTCQNPKHFPEPCVFGFWEVFLSSGSVLDYGKGLSLRATTRRENHF